MSQLRVKRALFGSATALIAKFSALGVSIVTTPMMLDYFGQTQFGVWIAITSLLGFFSFSDLGIGNGILIHISQAYGLNDKEKIRSVVSNGFALLATVSISILTTFAALNPILDFGKLLGVANVTDDYDITLSVLLVTLSICINIAFGLVQKVQSGLQKTAITNLWLIGSSLLSVVLLFGAVQAHLSMPWLIGIFAGTPAICNVFNFFLFFFRNKNLSPKIQVTDFKTSAILFKTGSMFFILQLVAAVSYSSDSIIIAHTLDVSELSTFAVTEKLYSVIGIGLSVALQPFWPAYTEAIARKDWLWIRKTFWRILLVSIGSATIASSVLLIFGRSIIDLWTGSRTELPGYSLLWAFSVWKIVESISTSIAVLLNGAQQIASQIAIALFSGAAIAFFKVHLTPIYGVSALPFTSAAIVLLMACLPGILIVTRYLRISSQ